MIKMAWQGYEEIKKREKELQRRIYDVLRDIVLSGKYRFHGVSFSDVKLGWQIDNREADLVILGPSSNDVFLIIETKRKEVKPGVMSRVTDKAFIGQALTYAALAKRRGFNVYFIAVCNPGSIAVYKVPKNVDTIVSWDAIRERRYEDVISLDIYRDFLDPDKYAVFTLTLELSENFFQRLLDDLVNVWKRKKKPFEIQSFSLKVIEDLRDFVYWLSSYVGPLLREKYDVIIKNYEEQFKKIGYIPEPRDLARQMAYVFMNKIVFYKVLERFWGKLPKLEALYGKTISGKAIESASDYLEALNTFFQEAIRVTGDFEPIFITGVFDEVALPDDPDVLRGIDNFIEYIDYISIEKLGDVIGYVYELLIPPRERHVWGQLYTPPAVCELITRWCIRSPNDVCLGPGCGSGTFEIYGYRRLYELKTSSKYGKWYPKAEIHEKILSQIIAFDINEFPVHLTAMNLAMRNPRAPSTKMNVFVADFFTLHPCVESLLPYKIKIFGPEK